MTPVPYYRRPQLPLTHFIPLSHRDAPYCIFNYKMYWFYVLLQEVNNWKPCDKLPNHKIMKSLKCCMLQKQLIFVMKHYESFFPFEVPTVNNMQTQRAHDRRDLDFNHFHRVSCHVAMLCYCALCIQCHGNFVESSETPTALCHAL